MSVSRCSGHFSISVCSPLRYCDDKTNQIRKYIDAGTESLSPKDLFENVPLSNINCILDIEAREGPSLPMPSHPSSYCLFDNKFFPSCQTECLLSRWPAATLIVHGGRPKARADHATVNDAKTRRIWAKKDGSMGLATKFGTH